MKVKESLKQGKHTSKKFFILEILCIVISFVAIFIMSSRIEKEKPNATDLTQNGAIGTEKDKYVYLQIDGLSDEIAIGPEDEKYYVAINGNEWYIVSLSSADLEELNDIHEYTYGKITSLSASGANGITGIIKSSIYAKGGDSGGIVFKITGTGSAPTSYQTAGIVHGGDVGGGNMRFIKASNVVSKFGLTTY